MSAANRARSGYARRAGHLIGIAEREKAVGVGEPGFDLAAWPLLPQHDRAALIEPAYRRDKALAAVLVFDGPSNGLWESAGPTRSMVSALANSAARKPTR